MGTLKLAILRASRRWTLEHAAEQLAISVATLERWEKGKVRPRGYNFHRLCEISEAELDEALEEGGKTFSAAISRLCSV